MSKDQEHMIRRDPAPTYELKTFEEIHGKNILNLIPKEPGLILDIGSGSGRDAAWFASHGHEVVAVEPEDDMRTSAKITHTDPHIQWHKDSLPSLEKIIRSNCSFDLIWLSAIWMHVLPTQRKRAFRKLTTLLKPGGKMYFSLRQPPDEKRGMHEAHIDEIQQFSIQSGLSVIHTQTDVLDSLGRAGVEWETICLQAPDDGLGALPLLRHIIINDSKSATYKPALLRTLSLIANYTKGMVDIDEDTAKVPLGLIALYWIRSFKNLVSKRVTQTSHGKLSFVKPGGFLSLHDVSCYDLRIGFRFTGENATALLKTFRDTINTIVSQPVNFITWPHNPDAHESRIFVPHRERHQGLNKKDITLNADFLQSFGYLHVPRHIWQAMGRYSTWVEPVLLDEWIRLMQVFQQEQEYSYDEFREMLRWLEPERETGLVRKLLK